MPSGGGGSSGNGACAGSKAVMTIAFQFAFESHLQESVATMARQYMRSIIASVQRIALALSSSRLVPQVGGVGHAPAATASPEAATLSRWICQSYRSVVRACKFKKFECLNFVLTLHAPADSILEPI